MGNCEPHGFISRDEWDKAFQKYFSKISEIDQKNHELLMTDRNCESWIKDYKKQSENIRKAYLENDQFKQHNIFYYTKHPENWTEEVADSLIAYLYRFWFVAEDVEAVYDSALSLLQYYKQKQDEIHIMKCKMVILSCYHFLDEIHFADICIQLCKEIQEILIRRYDELSQEDLSMALSVYDFQNNIRYDNLKIGDDFEQYFDEVLLPEYNEAVKMLKKFMSIADMSLPINTSLPRMLLNCNRMFVSIALHIHEDTLRDDQLQIIQEKAITLWKNQDENIYGRAEDTIGYLMANRFAMNISREELIQKCREVFSSVPKTLVDSNQVVDIISAAERFAIMVKTLTKEDVSVIENCQDLLSEYVQYLLSLPYGKVMTHIVDQTMYRNIIPLLKYLDNKNEIFSVLLDLTIFRQIQTAIHSYMVGESASLILDKIIDKQPELLTDLPGLSTIELVRENKQEILNYIMSASLVHDVGKILCTNEINMQYRHITDVEFETIKFHPISSSEILNSIPQLERYHSIAVGHHKSFDGTFGYPESFDNVNSKQKVFIDLIRICDSLDAATDTFGRLYAEPKRFQEVLKEFVMLKGRSYSDLLVDFIVKEKELQKELEILMEEGREDVYRHIYSLIQKKNKEITTSYQKGQTP